MSPRTANTAKLGRPEIWSYREPRQFVADFFAWKKLSDPRFSFRRLGQEAGLGSPSYIPRYLRGERNLKATTAAKLAAAMGLSVSEQVFFVALVEFANAEDPDQRAGWYRDILAQAARFGKTGTIDAARLAYFTYWYIPIVHAMASLSGFRPEPHWIAARTVPKLRSFDAKKALDTLIALGIFEIDSKGKFYLRERRLEVQPELHSLWIREYHRAMIRLAEQALDYWPADQRITSALTITCPNSLLPELLKKIDAYREDVFLWLVQKQLGMKSIDGDVVQVNFQAFRLTDIQNAGEK